MYKQIFIETFKKILLIKSNIHLQNKIISQKVKRKRKRKLQWVYTKRIQKQKIFRMKKLEKNKKR